MLKKLYNGTKNAIKKSASATAETVGSAVGIRKAREWEEGRNEKYKNLIDEAHKFTEEHIFCCNFEFNSVLNIPKPNTYYKPRLYIAERHGFIGPSAHEELKKKADIGYNYVRWNHRTYHEQPLPYQGVDRLGYIFIYLFEGEDVDPVSYIRLKASKF